MDALEAVIGQQSLFEHLRPDEIGRIARRFETLRLAEGEQKAFGASIEEARLIIVVTGRVELEVGSQNKRLRARLAAGDRYGEMSLLSGYPRDVVMTATKATAVAMIDRAGLDALLADFPAIALHLAGEISTELHVKNDALRQLLELHAENLSKEDLTVAVDERRRVLTKHPARVARLSPRALFRRLVVQQGAEPPFWMLVGFILSLSLARLVVFAILHFHMEKTFFALVPGSDPNPKHIHHFNYGLILIGVSGLVALFPFGRRALRVLAFAFGFGLGLFFDEFALFWNLNPEYAQSLSLIAAGVAMVLLLQLTYFRGFWAGVWRRIYFKLRRDR